MKTILLFKCYGILKPEALKQIRNELKSQVEEGVVAIDDTIQWPELIRIPDGCEYDIVVQSLEEDE